MIVRHSGVGVGDIVTEGTGVIDGAGDGTIETDGGIVGMDDVGVKLKVGSADGAPVEGRGVVGPALGLGDVGIGVTLGSAVGIGLTVGFDDMLGTNEGNAVGSGAEHADIDPALLPEPSSDPSLSSIDHEISYGYDPALTTTV